MEGSDPKRSADQSAAPCTAPHNHPHADDVLVMCEECGCDLLQSSAHWHTCAEEYNGEGCVPLCEQCHEENSLRAYED